MAQRAASNAQGRLNRRFLLVAILLAGLSAALVYARIAATDESGGGDGSASVGDQPVVVARVPIKQRTTITADMLEVKNVAASGMTAGALTDVERVVGLVTKYPIEVNQQLTAAAVVDTSRPVADAALNLVVPTGMRAVSINASQVKTSGGLILPGDFVDIIWTCCQGQEVIAKTILSNVQVAAVAQTIVSSGPVAGVEPGTSTEAAPVAADQAPPVPDAVTITLLLTPVQAQQVVLAEGNGSLRAGLRGIGDLATTDAGVSILIDVLPESDVARLPASMRPDIYSNQP
jgi:Flp pilus assembly protein CpaB